MTCRPRADGMHALRHFYDAGDAATVVPAVLYDGKSRGAAAYVALARELMARQTAAATPSAAAPAQG